MILNQRKDKIEYTDDQLLALNAIVTFLKNPNVYDVKQNTFKLAGYAGTGKTTIIENIFTYARDVLQYDVYVTAPTNAAIKVLVHNSRNWKSNFINHNEKFRTLHSLLYGEPDEDGNWHPKCNFSKGQLFIIDESSMIDTFINDDINKYVAIRGAKVIKIGDGFQLEPVGPDPQVLKNPDIEMKEVKRHSGMILDYVTKLRKRKRSFVPSITRNDVHVLPIDHLGGNWLVDVKNNNDSVFIVGTNKSRIHLNILARDYKFGEENKEVLKEFESMISISNSDTFKNSETFLIQKVFTIRQLNMIQTKKGDELGECYYARIKVNNVERELLFFPKTLRPSIYHAEIDVSTIPFDLEHLIDVRRYRNKKLSRHVLITTYGYAITAHKSQGSQWEKVYIHNDFWGDNPRWLYTAASRAISLLTLSIDSSKVKLDWKDIK